MKRWNFYNTDKDGSYMMYKNTTRYIEDVESSKKTNNLLTP